MTIPCLLSYGQNDPIEDVAQYTSRADRLLASAGNTEFTILLLPHAGHELAIDSPPGTPFEWRRTSPALYELMSAWIKVHAK